MPRIGCEFIFAMPAPLIAPRCSCWRRFLLRGPRSINIFRSWRSRVSNADFSVVDGLIYLQQPSAVQDPELLLRMFDFMAHHGLKLSTTTEYRIEQVLPSMAATPPQGAELWRYLAGHSDRAIRGRCFAGHAFAAIAHLVVARTEAD